MSDVPSTLYVEIGYWPQTTTLSPPFANGQFRSLLMELKETFEYQVSLLATERSGFNMRAMSSDSYKPVAIVTYQPPPSWNSNEDDDKVLRDTINTFWQDNAHIMFKRQSIGNGSQFPCIVPNSKGEAVITEKCPLRITLTTSKMTGPNFYMDSPDKIADKITSAAALKSLPHTTIFKVRLEDGYCKALLKEDIPKKIPVIQLLIEADPGVHIEASFAKELYRIVSEAYPYPNYYVYVICNQ